jgi:long-chain fatty acid transport protein
MPMEIDRTTIMNAKHAGLKLLRRAKHVAHSKTLLLAAATFLPVMVYGLGSAIPNQDAEATARGNAFIATANNPSAIYYNPAGITQLEGIYVQYGLHNLAVNSEYESLDGTIERNSEFNVASVPQLYCTFSPKDSAFSYGFGIYAPFGLGVEWSTNTPFSTLALKSELMFITFNPVVAWQVTPTLSIAAGPTINWAKVDLRQAIGLAPNDEFDFDGDGWTFGATAGLLWKPHEKWAFGLNYRTPTAVDFEGKSQLKPYAPEENTSAELDFPQSVGGGIAYWPTPEWNVEVYLIWTDWDVVDNTTFKRPSGNIPFTLNWESSIMTGIGATRYLDNNRWFISAGYFFSQHSTSEANYTPLVPDTDLHVGSAGFGYKGEHWNYALSLQLITGPWRVIDSSAANPISGETADGKYSWLNGAVNFSIGYHF